MELSHQNVKQKNDIFFTIIDSRLATDLSNILESFNDYLVSVGKHLCKKVFG